MTEFGQKQSINFEKIRLITFIDKEVADMKKKSVRLHLQNARDYLDNIDDSNPNLKRNSELTSAASKSINFAALQIGKIPLSQYHISKKFLESNPKVLALYERLAFSGRVQ